MRNSIVVTALLTILLVVSASAGVPTAINYQGRLTDGAGAPVTDGAYSVTFTIYDAPSGGNSKWTETQNVNTADGLFAVLLGSLNPILDTVFNGTTRYLGITVAADPELTPRTAMVSVPYAQRVSTVDGASGGTITSEVSIGPGHTNTGGDGFVVGNANIVIGSVSSITGGGNNSVSGEFSIIGGGENNVSIGDNTVIGGGVDNQASGYLAVVTGGATNTSSGILATIGGGIGNIAAGDSSVIGGGAGNNAVGRSTTIGGGQGNTATLNRATVAGGQDNHAYGRRSAIGGGRDNYVGGDLSTISGGFADTIDATAAYSYLFGIGSKLTQDSTFMVDMPHVRFGDEASGYEFPTTDGAVDQVMSTDGAGNVSWSTLAGGGGGGWADDGNAVRLETAGDSVGIGTATPSEKLEVAGNVLITGKATIGPGHTNTGIDAFVAGNSNTASSNYATVGGGSFNTASGISATVSGGSSNTASGDGATVGGSFNTASDTGATVSGGLSNEATGSQSAVGGGFFNIASGDRTTVGGGSNNTASDWAATVAGGETNTASSSHATVGGGSNNTVIGNGACVAGGQFNTASGVRATVGGGQINDASNSWTTVGGGTGNTSSGDRATVGGGEGNTSSGFRATVGGGRGNGASGYCSTVTGGEFNVAAGRFSFAAGSKARAHHDGSVVIVANNVLTPHDSSSSGGVEQMVLRADGGIYITDTSGFTPYDNTKLITTRGGAYLSGNGTSWTNASDKNMKENFIPVNGTAVLEQISELPITEWNYKEDDESVKHIGPMAQDFHEIFGLGSDDKSISTIDPSGIALAAIGALYEKSKRVDALESELAELRTLVETLIENQE